MRMAPLHTGLKKAVNLTVDRQLLASAKRHDLNLSAVLEHALVNALKAKEREKWLADNRLGFEAYNGWIEENGVFGDALRTF